MSTILTGPGLFVTGTDTGVGKTLVAAAFAAEARARGLRAAVFKPVATGAAATDAGLHNQDALTLMAASNVVCDYETVNPYAFAPPIAPHIAAEEAGVSVELEHLDACFERLAADADLVIVEGAGGWLVPLGPDLDFPALARRWRLPVLLVVGLRLGCLNHALLTVEAIRARQLTLAGWVGNRIDPAFSRSARNIETLEQILPVPCLGVIEHFDVPDFELARTCLTLA